MDIKKSTKGDKTRAKLIETTADLLLRNGFHAVGLNQILEESGTPRGSLYFHFPGGKEELACASLEAGAAQAQAELQFVLEHAAGPAEAFNIMCAHASERMAASGWQSGCPLATTALEASGKSEAVRLIAERHFVAMSGLTAQFLERFKVPPEKASILGQVIFAGWEGALLMAKVERSAVPIRNVSTTFTTLLEDEIARHA